jgi:hypothetical protein
MSPVIIDVQIPPEQIEALELLAGGSDSFLRSLNLSAAEEISTKMQDHLREFDEKHPNAMGWPRSHFVMGLGKDIELDQESVTVDGASITASPELFHRLNGGDVSPKMRKHLAIPARAAAYAAGRRPNSPWCCLVKAAWCTPSPSLWLKVRRKPSSPKQASTCRSGTG